MMLATGWVVTGLVGLWLAGSDDDSVMRVGIGVAALAILTPLALLFIL